MPLKVTSLVCGSCALCKVPFPQGKEQTGRYRVVPPLYGSGVTANLSKYVVIITNRDDIYEIAVNKHIQPVI